MGSPGNATWPMSLDEKPEVLRRLQGHVHFEKTITASSAPGHVGHYSKLALPMAFVKQHGDKFQKSVLLQTVLSLKAWPVRLEICFMTTKYTTQIKFSGGWRAFADFNGLQEGDSLIFRLMAMSKFEVYVFGSTRCPKGPVIRNITTNFQCSGSFENQAGSRNLSTDVIAPLSTDVKTEVLRKLQGRIYFEKTVTASTASGYPSRDPKLAMPSQFVHSHGDKFLRSVILRVTSSSREWPVKLSSAPQFCFRGGWRAFAEFNGLLEGDSLIFSLTAVSEFEVYVFSSTGSPKKPPDSQSAASSGCIDAGIARKKAKHSDVCQCWLRKVSKVE
ncbi:hypothetical protein M758_2G162200 [Ceratodon purpureus]|nr:hypothetical protein M758_2G162200 [Ceratodon purpureus]